MPDEAFFIDTWLLGYSHRLIDIDVTPEPPATRANRPYSAISGREAA